MTQIIKLGQILRVHNECTKTLYSENRNELIKYIYGYMYIYIVYIKKLQI